MICTFKSFPAENRVSLKTALRGRFFACKLQEEGPVDNAVRLWITVSKDRLSASFTVF
jgi:hypothetical protein